VVDSSDNEDSIILLSNIPHSSVYFSKFYYPVILMISCVFSLKDINANFGGVNRNKRVYEWTKTKQKNTFLLLWKWYL